MTTGPTPEVPASIPAPEPSAPQPSGSPAASAFSAPQPGGDGASTVNLNTVTFEQLRGEDLTVTQATRLLAHRERLGGFQSVDDLDQVAGFPGDLLEDLKQRSTI
jgi:competence protein ComEA